MIRGGLFTRYWLDDGIRQTDAYRALGAGQVDAFAADIGPSWQALESMGSPNEAETASEFIYPVLDRLGWVRLPQQETSLARRDITDELLFLNPQGKASALRLSDRSARFRHAAVVVENEARDTRLDRAKGQAEAPSNQILRYLKRSDGIAGSAVRSGLLTNGRFWRLYHAGAQRRDEDFIEIALGDLFGPLPPPAPEGADQRHWLRVFLLIFGRQSFQPDPQGRTFLDDSLSAGRRFEERITDRLSEAVFDSVFPSLVAGLADADPRRDVADAGWRGAIKEAALILLFRFLFILYAEDRGLLPVDHPGYRDYSFRRMRDDAASVAEGRLVVREGGHTWWPRIRDLCDAIARGSPELGLPEYNGGLFDDSAHELLTRVQLRDPLLARMLDDLSRAEIEGARRRINYRDLTVQQLGAIYERLLERDVIVRDGRVEVSANDTARHRSGSFFTTQKLVSLILTRAVGPLLEERRAAFQTRAAALAGDRRRNADKLADLRRFDPAEAFVSLRVCDPAMGSGHFLVSLVDYLAGETLVAMADARNALPDYRSPLAERIGVIREHIRAQADRHGWVVAEEHLDDRALLRRIILKRCIYGVDLNPLAVELAKLALWLHCFTVGAPLSFLDHHLRTGDSLLGERVGDVLAELREDYKLAGQLGVQSALNAAAGMARVEELTDADIGEVKESAESFREVELMTAGLRRFLDFYHARRWAAPGAEAIGVAAFFGGNFGDPIRIIAGDQPLRPPKADAMRIGRGRTAIEAETAYAAVQAWLARVPRWAAEKRLLHWQPAFPGVWSAWEAIESAGGFDAVVGNPPYVRQEQIKALKPALQGLYDTFDGVADLYVYFYEQGLRLLRRGGRLSFVITNKWIKAGYAEKLREKLGRDAWMETVIDFGHAKGFFPDADVMPCVIVARRPDPAQEAPEQTAVAVIPRDAVDLTRLGEQVQAATFFIPRANLGKEAWLLEPPEVAALMEKLKRNGVTLKDYAGVSPRRGVLTGFNEAFVIDSATRERLIREDPRSEEIIKPYLRGQDIDRWSTAWAGQWMIFTRYGTDIDVYPAIKAHLTTFRDHLEPKPPDWKPSQAEPEWHGRKEGSYGWFEIQDNVAFYREFASAKIVYQEIQFHPQYSIDRLGRFLNNKCCFIGSDNKWLVACLNSPIVWWHNWRHLGRAKDEALTPQAWQMELVPIPSSTADAEPLVDSLENAQADSHEAVRLLADWYRHSLDIETIPNALRSPFALDAEQFIAAIRKARSRRQGPLSAPAIRHIKDEHARTITPMARRLAEALRHEQLLSDLVNQAYGLTPEDVALMWRTAPPRMPIPPPAAPDPG